VIRQLDAGTVAKIAAGEVIERPASVVKELVENSIDAGSRRIVVICRRGGFDLIQVSDDGCGMAPEDAPLAFARHSTSKLSCADDLSRVTTLGFRGEALPSIAAVARVEMVTCPPGAPSGTRVVVEGGRVAHVEETAARPGTRVTVRDVLAGLPARRKFLSDPHREGLRCVDVVMRLAAGYPHIAFRLEMDGRQVLSTPGDGRLLDTLVALYGPGTARALIPVCPPEEDYPPGIVSVTGYVGGSATFRTRRWAQALYVNGRAVRAPGLVQAVEVGYGPMLPPGRHPFVILFLTVDPQHVDVNVHPTKAEVRLAREEAVKSLLVRVVTRALGASDMSRPLVADTSTGGWEGGPGQATESRGEVGENKQEAAVTLDLARHAGVRVGRTRLGEPGPVWELNFSRLRVIGQAMGTYLLVEGPEGLYVVDQHAAHERVFYEAMEFPQRSQLLLIPLVIETSSREREVLRAFRDEVSRAGFEVEPWEGDAAVVRAVPEWATGHEEACLRELLEELDEPVRGEAREHLRRATAACRAAVKAAMPLDQAEAQALVDQLARCENPWVCPHGRPTVLKVTRADLERHFGRR